MANVTGPGGAFAAAGFNGKYEAWNATFDYGPADVTGFSDNGWNFTENTSCKLSGSASGVMIFDAATTAPIPATALASTFLPSALAVTITLTVKTGCTWAFTGAVVNSNGSRSAKSGTRGDITHNFENQGAVTQTWDESA